MFALALEARESKTEEAVALLKARKAQRRLTVHERLVLKAEALFPGCEIVSHQTFDQ